MSEIQDRELFEHAIASLHGEFANMGYHLTRDAHARQLYSNQIRLMADDLRRQVESGQLNWRQAAEQANEVRNTIMNVVRSNSTAMGRAQAQSLKSQGITLNDLIARKTMQLHGANADFNRLSDQHRNIIYEEIVRSSGRSRPSVDIYMRKASAAGRGLIFLTLAISVYNVTTAEDKVDVVKKEAAVAGAGVGGGIAGGALAGLACGPGAPVCVTVGAFVGGALAAFGVSYFW